MPDNRKPLIYGAFPVCRNYTVRAHVCLPLCRARGRCQEPERDAGPCGCPHHAAGLCPFFLGAQNAGDPEYLLPCTGADNRSYAVTVSVSFSGNVPIPTAFGGSIANGINLRNSQTLFILASLLQIHYTVSCVIVNSFAVLLLLKMVPPGRVTPFSFFTATGAEHRSP